jgi:FAD:protein FMN transferase
MQPYTYAWEALGTKFTLTIWDQRSPDELTTLTAALVSRTHAFDAHYSRFKADSLVSALASHVGLVTVPAELTAMLRLYAELYAATDGKINPAIGFALADTGYDAAYSLTPKDTVRRVPAFTEALTIVDDTHLELHEPVLLDLGALGKGFLIDQLYAALMAEGVQRFLVDGSGDIRYYSTTNEPIACGLEHPVNPSLVIGTLILKGGSLCASAINRRQWRDRNHYLDPHTTASPHATLATWVYADSAALADGLSSALFFVAPEALFAYDFEYCIVNHELRMKKSAGFTADFF